MKEKYEDTKGVIRSRYSKKDRQHNGNKMDKRTNNELQNITQKAKDQIPVHSKHLTTFVRQIPLLDYTVELCSLEMNKQRCFPLALFIQDNSPTVKCSCKMIYPTSIQLV